ncbi:MAG: response regulator [Betaproteobacteria bacterium]|nr:response regulator [Betaproteobacteria bacterium]
MARILVVDDDVSLRELLRLHLSMHGHSVLAAADATEAIRALLEDAFQLVVCDVNMPYLNGIELLRAIRGDEKTAHIPVILLTGHGDDEIWSEATVLGISGYLTKPVVAVDLQKLIERTLKTGA